ncbi:hypothetical protein F4677DRAFT_459175 [Hypoxylon crocopeplum]|nr:hypothetical protein F4677DRAFT_459175 [Hypoxylon crocopeplum]
MLRQHLEVANANSGGQRTQGQNDLIQLSTDDSEEAQGIKHEESGLRPLYNPPLTASPGVSKAPGAPNPPTLLTLPVEIRLEILEHLLVLPPSTSPPSNKNIYSSGRAPAPVALHPAILRANHQLHAEGLPLLYERNIFLAHNAQLASLPRLQRAYGGPVLSERHAALVTRLHVCVRLDAEPGYDRARAAAQLSGKQEVVLEAWQALWRGSGPDVLRLFEGVRGVRRARVVGCVAGFEDYARWLERAMMLDVGVDVEPFFWDAVRRRPPDLGRVEMASIL